MAGTTVLPFVSWRVVAFTVAAFKASLNVTVTDGDVDTFVEPLTGLNAVTVGGTSVGAVELNTTSTK